MRSLPYLNWVPIKKKDRGKKSVTRHDPRRAFHGINLYNSRPRYRAQLIGMDGKILHRWSSPLGRPSAEEKAWLKVLPILDFEGWQQIELMPNGELLVNICYSKIIKLDVNSKLLWQVDIPAHHDIEVATNGDIYTLTGKKLKLKRGGRLLPLVDNQIVILSADGKKKRSVSLFQVLSRSALTRPLLETKLRWVEDQFKHNFAFYQLLAGIVIGQKNLKKIGDAVTQIIDGTFKGGRRLELMLMTMLSPMDILHANTIEILRRDETGLGKQGDLLISVRDLNLLALLDGRSYEIKWTWGGAGVLDRQHQPSVLSNGNILVFDNRPTAGRSKVIELDPRAKKIVWAYYGPPTEEFFSMVRGGCQQLPNGNVLITESDRGRVIEVTRSGAIVWEYYNPDLIDSSKGDQRAPISRMTRFRPEDVPPALRKGAHRDD